MTILTGVCKSFISELPVKVHDFTAASDIFKVALFTSGSSIDEDTIAYDPGGDVDQIGFEVVGTGYGAGGVSIASVTPILVAGVVVFDFADATWGPTASFTAAGALVYNDTDPGKAAVAVFDFGGNQVVTAGNFNLIMPLADSVNAILRINT